MTEDSRPPRILVCGGRDYADPECVDRVLGRIGATFPEWVLVHGAAKGADRLADEWAQLHGVPTLEYPADWNGQGPSAGPLRNERMLRIEQPLLVIAFPGGRGTRHMISIAERSGTLVWKVSSEVHLTLAGAELVRLTSVLSRFSSVDAEASELLGLITSERSRRIEDLLDSWYWLSHQCNAAESTDTGEVWELMAPYLDRWRPGHSEGKFIDQIEAALA